MQEPGTLGFCYECIKQEPGEANMRKSRFLHAGSYCIHKV